jgi:transposase InsO family protein
MFKLFHAYVQTQFHVKTKILQSDNGSEYMSHSFQEFKQACGIIFQRSCPSTPQENGVAERKSSHLFDIIRTLTYLALV